MYNIAFNFRSGLWRKCYSLNKGAEALSIKAWADYQNAVLDIMSLFQDHDSGGLLASFQLLMIFHFYQLFKKLREVKNWK